MFAAAVMIAACAGSGARAELEPRYVAIHNALAATGLVAVVLAAGYTTAIAVATDVPGARVPLVTGIGALLALPPTAAYALTAGGVGRAARLFRRRPATAGPLRAEAG